MQQKNVEKKTQKKMYKKMQKKKCKKNKEKKKEEKRCFGLSNRKSIWENMEFINSIRIMGWRGKPNTT